MKKFVKVSLLTAGILTAAGIVLCLVSMVAGGTSVIRYIRNDEYFEERFETVGDMFGDIASSFDHIDSHHNKARTIVNGITGSGNPDRLEVNGDVYYDAGYESRMSIENIRNLDLDLGAGTLIIKEKDTIDNTLDIYIQGVGGCDYYIKEKDGTLCVEGFKGINNGIVNNVFDGNCITMCLPAGCRFEEVELEIGAGVMEIGNLHSNEIEAAIGAGELILNYVETNELSMEVGAGVVETNGMTVRGNSDISVSLGSVIFEGSILGNLDAECDMGSIEMNLKGKETDHNYEVECGAGNVEIGSFSAGAIAMEKRIYNGASSNFDVDCSMGNISIFFYEQE